MQARCYPFNMPKRWFHNMNPQVHHNLLYYSYAIDSHRYPLFILIWELGHQQVWHWDTSKFGTDTVLTVPPYPFVLDDPTDVRLEECWFAGNFAGPSFISSAC